MTPRERHVRICKAARAIQQGTEYAALIKRGYGRDEIAAARQMLGLNDQLPLNDVHGQGEGNAKQDTHRHGKKNREKSLDAHGDPLLI